MKLLTISENTSENRWAPTARCVRYQTRERRLRCPACATHDEVVSGPVVVEVEEGSRWPDLFGGSDGGATRLIVSERVLEVFDRTNVTGYSAGPVEFRAIHSERLRVLATSVYYCLNLEPGIEFARSYLDGFPCEHICPYCDFLKPDAPKELHERTGLTVQWVQRYSPIMETWNGKDIVEARTWPRIICCTPKILELAHKHRWSNFRFNMVDAILRHTSYWGGIDYRAKSWPPERLYPPPRSEGLSMQEWLEMLAGEPYPGPTVASRAHRAYQALLDFDEQVVPELDRMMREGNQDQQKNAAEVLRRLARMLGIPLTDDQRRRILEVRPDVKRESLPGCDRTAPTRGPRRW